MMCYHDEQRLGGDPVACASRFNDTRFERCVFFFFQAEDGIRDLTVTGVQTCALPICPSQKYSLSGSALRFENGRTAIELPVPDSWVVALRMTWVRASVSRFGADERSSSASNSSRFCNCFRSANNSFAVW